MADHVGACTAVLTPLYELIKAHVFAAERIHGDDTTVPVLAKGHCRTGRIWTYVRDGRPFGGTDPPAAVFFYSRDRAGIHPERHLASIAGYSSATYMQSSILSTRRIESQDRSPKRNAGLTHDAKLFELADVASKARNQTTAISKMLTPHQCQEAW